MADFAGFLLALTNVTAVAFTNRFANNYKNASHQATGFGLRVNTPSALDPNIIAIDTVVHATKTVHTSVDWSPAVVEDKTTNAFDFFERFHVVPRSFNFGNVITQQSKPIEVFSAFRHTQHSWLSFLNNAGAGTSLVVQPSLAHVYNPLTGTQMNVTVATNGVPKVDTTLDFVFDSGTTKVPIFIQRVLLFSVPPEMPYQEILEFFTDVIVHKDGTEQRISCRKCPRQLFEWNLIMSDGQERAIIDNILFDWQSRSFGIPIWKELTTLSTAAIVGATVLTVASTDFADYRIGGLVLVYKDQFTFDVLTLASFTSTTVTLGSGTLNAYSAGAFVMPLRIGVADNTIQGSRYLVNGATQKLRFRVVDNDVSLADTSAFNSFNGKVLLDDPNVTGGPLSESLEKSVVILDNNTGLTYQDSSWDRNRRVSSKTFYATNRQKLWNIRKLLYALGGRQTSFYLPTFCKELEPTDNVVSGTATINVKSCGYTTYVRQRQPRNVVRIVFADGSTPLLRTVIGSSILDANRETLTLNSNWPSNFTVAQIARVEYVEKVRFDSDSIAINHMLGDNTTKVSAPVKVVLE